MRYRVVSYCPDRHIEYDGRTPYEVGVGGGITARVRMAKALRKLGHEVQMVVNCRRREFIDGVEYIPLDQVKRIEADVLILNTSGGDLDLSPALSLEVDAALKIVWAQGVSKPKGLENTEYDYLYAVSNFIADVAKNVWGVEDERIFVTYNAFEEELFSQAEQSNPSRDPHRLVYFSHPSKGLETAVRIVERLRRHNRVFRLNVFGGARLWGEKEADIPDAEGVDFGGLAGQRKLAMELLKSTYSIHLQSRDEPCPLSAVEALRAGCVVLASPVGSYPELIRSGQNGYLIEGDHESDLAADQAADLILSLQRDRHHLQEIRWNARRVIWESLTLARAWQGHWDQVLTGRRSPLEPQAGNMECKRCGAESYHLADGLHCSRCGLYFGARIPDSESVQLNSSPETGMPRRMVESIQKSIESH